MNRHIILGTLALSLAACGPHTTIRETSAGGGVAPIASGADVAAPPPGADAPLPRAWLWRVSGGDAASPSYVLGTLHAGLTLATALPAPFDQQLSGARTLVLDVDFRGITQSLAESSQTRTRGARPLDRALGRDTWQLVTTELGGQLQPALVRALSPSALIVFLRQVRMAEAEAAAEGREPIAGIASSAELDGFLLDGASRDGVPTVVLESPVQGLGALAALPAADAIAVLHHLIDQSDQARQEAATLRAAYLALDEDTIAQLIASEWTPPQREVVFTQPSQAWATQVAGQLQQGNAFIALDVQHLVGEGSFLDALRAAGYTVERLGE